MWASKNIKMGAVCGLDGWGSRYARYIGGRVFWYILLRNDLDYVPTTKADLNTRQDSMGIVEFYVEYLIEWPT